MIVRERLDNGLCLLTESMADVRSVAFGIWLIRGSRHESAAQSGIAHFVEHMLFKGTSTRSAQDIAQEIDSIGGQLDAFTAKDCASYYVRVLDEHLPRAFDVLSDLLLRPVFDSDEIVREKKVVLEEIKMVEDTPDDFVHELYTQRFWSGHPLGRPILGLPETVSSLDHDALCDYFGRVYTADNLVVAAAGNVDHSAIRDLVASAFGDVPASGETVSLSTPRRSGRAPTPRKIFGTMPPLFGSEWVSTGSRRPLRVLSDEYCAGRFDEFPVVPEYPRETRSSLQCQQWSNRLPRLRRTDGLRGLRRECCE